MAAGRLIGRAVGTGPWAYVPIEAAPMVCNRKEAMRRKIDALKVGDEGNLGERRIRFGRA